MSETTATSPGGADSPLDRRRDAAVTPPPAPPADGAPTRVLETLAHEARPATVARHFVRSTLASWGEPDELTGLAELAVSELVANAVRHGDGPTSMTVTRGADSVQIAVWDRNTAEPTVRHPGDLDEGHRGMLIIESVSTSWGYRAEGPGKVVWVEFGRAS